MAPDNDLVPLKRVLTLCNISRATLWRVSRAGVEGFPRATKQNGRIYWGKDQLAAIKDAISKFEGRTVFDQRRANARRAKERQRERLICGKEAKLGRRRRASAKPLAQGDLFGG